MSHLPGPLMNTLLRWGAWSRRRVAATLLSGAPHESGRGTLRSVRIPLPRRRVAIDPFCALEVQLALARVEREIEELGRADGRFARGHHLIAARLAYDQLLGEACRLAGVELPPDHGALRRLVAEAELRTRGWFW
jgi:hypothetical protein